MIRRERSALRTTCDGCGQFLQDTRYRSFKESWQEAQALGWAAVATDSGKDWNHYCPQCVNERVLP
jgi:hypothetical protein